MSAPWRVYLFGLVPISPLMASPLPKKKTSGVRRWLQPFVTLKEEVMSETTTGTETAEVDHVNRLGDVFSQIVEDNFDPWVASYVNDAGRYIVRLEAENKRLREWESKVIAALEGLPDNTAPDAIRILRDRLAECEATRGHTHEAHNGQQTACAVSAEVRRSRRRSTHHRTARSDRASTATRGIGAKAGALNT